jgi:hypothetical protein
MLNNCIVSSMNGDSDILPINMLFRFEQKMVDHKASRISLRCIYIANCVSMKAYPITTAMPSALPLED